MSRMRRYMIPLFVVAFVLLAGWLFNNFLRTTPENPISIALAEFSANQYKNRTLPFPVIESIGWPVMKRMRTIGCVYPYPEVQTATLNWNIITLVYSFGIHMRIM